MKSTSLLLSISLIFLLGCSKSKNDTDVSLKNLPQSIQDAINANKPDCRTCGLTIKLVQFRDELVYEMYSTSHLCDGIIVYYDQQGNEYYVSPDIYSEYMETSQVVKTIWSCNPVDVR